MEIRRHAAVIAGVTWIAAGCTTLLGADLDYHLVEEDGVVCAAFAECEAAAPVCRTAAGCEGGWCVFEDAPEGTALTEQVTGDCAERVCDGAGRVKVVPVESDVPDDGNVCTLDECVGTTPMHTPVLVGSCYSGPAGTEGRGICQAGVQQCDAAGNPLGECVDEVLPAMEVCDTAEVDEDCDGLVNEEGSECTCGDHVVSAWLGETCDDGGTNDGDICSPICQSQEILQIAAGGFHTCALLSQGRVKCWGENNIGQLGLGDTSRRGDGPGEMGDDLPEVNLGSGKRAVALAAGSTHSCALLADGSLKCWGYNEYGVLGLGDTSARGDAPLEMGDNLPGIDLGSGRTAVAVSAGAAHTCAILDDGSVKCWGYNFHGELGVGDTEHRGDAGGEMGDNLPVVDLGLGQSALAISAAGGSTCALLNNGALKCWGGNGFGILGLGDSNPRGDNPEEMGDNLPAVNLGSGKTATAIASGYLHTCALLNDGTVKCWGYNEEGALGLGDVENRGDDAGEMGDGLPAVDLGSGETATSVAVGVRHTCAALSSGSIKCWGYNSDGELGIGNTQQIGDGPGEMGDTLSSVALGSGKIAVSIATFYYHSCAKFDDGSVKCWGSNTYGSLGLGDTASRGDAPGEMGDALPTVKLFSPFW